MNYEMEAELPQRQTEFGLREAAKHLLEAWDNGTHNVVDSLEILRAALAESDGWRQCAKGQKTTQFCGLLEEAVKVEREACARVCELLRPSKREYDHRFYDACTASAIAIRARGIND